MTKERQEYIRNWIYRAREDIAVMENLANSGIENYTSSICFHAQQAVEKYLKAFLIYHNIDFPRTHDVDYLLNECQKIDRENFNFNLKNLTEFSVSVRYPDDFYIPAPTETNEYIELAKDIKDTIEALLRSVM